MGYKTGVQNWGKKTVASTNVYLDAVALFLDQGRIYSGDHRSVDGVASSRTDLNSLSTWSTGTSTAVIDAREPETEIEGRASPG
jgi:hypothetical protein